tara:strand:+ start:980 stop:1189 length:210 start_codon:yes stop_codon:yes gene_type:complete
VDLPCLSTAKGSLLIHPEEKQDEDDPSEDSDLYAAGLIPEIDVAYKFFTLSPFKLTKLGKIDLIALLKC